MTLNRIAWRQLIWRRGLVTPRQSSQPKATEMATSNVLGQFDPKNERIDDYKERFDFYCVAHGVEERKQKALFLTSIGQQMYAKLKT